MKLIIKKFENEYVICEKPDTKEIVNLDRSYFSAESNEGDLVDFIDGQIMHISLK